MEREQRLNVRFTEDEARMVKALAEHEGMSISDWVRQAVRRAFASTFRPKKSKK